MAISWHYISDYCAIGIDWCASTGNSSVSLSPKVYRWDEYRTDNYGGSFDEYLSPDPSGAGAWYDLDFGSGSGTRTLDSFATRTYTKTHDPQTVSLKIAWSNIGSYSSGFHSLGSGSKTWTYTVPALASYAVKYSANGGSGAPSAQTKWYGETLKLSATKPTRTGYTFQGWGTSSTDTSVDYDPEDSYTANKAVTLYAIWKVVKPAAPSGVTATRNSDTKNAVKWTRGSNADITYSSIKVERKTDGGSWSQIASVAGTATSYSDTTTSANHYYQYRVRAYNSTGYSSYATCSTVVYNTPSAPTKVTAARSGETTVELTIANAPKTATVLEIQRSTDASTWETVATIEGAAVTSATDNPGGGTFYYRARNTRDSLASAWSAASNAVVTICAPAAPTLSSPASGSVVNKANESITFEWAHNPIDGSAQEAAKLRYSVDKGGTYTEVEIEGDAASCTLENSFEINSEVTWGVCTKGAHADYGPWSDNRVFYVYQVPSVAFAQPTDGFTVENTPIAVELQYDDASGSLASATLSVSDGSKVVYTRNMGTETACEIQNTEWLPDNGVTYTLNVTVRSSSTLTSEVAREIAVSFVLPRPVELVIEPDAETGYVSLVANVPEDDELEVPVSVSIWRESEDGRVLLGEGLQAGAGVVDMYAPLNVGYQYTATSFADSGAANSTAFDAKLETPWAFLYFTGGGIARGKWNPEDSWKLDQEVDFVQYIGREYPVAYMRDAMEETHDVTVTLMDRDEARAFRKMMATHEPIVAKLWDSLVFHAVPQVQGKPKSTVRSYWGEVAVKLTRIDGEAL